MAIVWKGHFFNREHTVSQFLAPIEDYHIQIQQGYEETSGQPPLFRSAEGIPNVNGTVRYQFTCAVDHQGGRSIMQLDEDSLVDLLDYFVSCVKILYWSLCVVHISYVIARHCENGAFCA